MLPGSAAIVDLAVHACGARPAPAVAVADDGAWSTTAYPRVTTEYAASVGETSVNARVAVKPVVVLRMLGGLRYEVRVKAARSFAGRLVRVEVSQSNGRSRLLRRVRLGRASRARFRLRPRELRPWLEGLYVAVPKTPCLEPAVSNTINASRP